MARRLSAPLLLAVAYGVLILAWVLTNPPGSSPDEPAHLVRARATARGQWVGTPATYAPTPEFGPRELPWINRATRAFDVEPKSVFPTIATCNAFHPEVSSRCLNASLRLPRSDTAPRSYIATYQPFAYLPAGVVANFFSDPRAAIVGGRVVFGGLAALLLALTVAALWRPGDNAWPLLGVLIATSPAVLFAAASLSPSGLEIAGSMATFAVALRICSGPEDRSSWWAALAVSAGVVALCRPLGPMWVVAALAAAVALSTPAAARASLRRGGRGALISAGVIAAAIATSLAWGLLLSPAPPRPSHLADGVLRAGSELPEVLREMIGVFGWLDTGMPAAAYATWRMMLVALVVLALLVGTRRARRLLVAVIAAIILLTILIAVFVTFPTGFGLQGRYVLPLATAVPLVAGEIFRRHRTALGHATPRQLPVLAAGAASVVHLVAWYTNARRHAVGVRGPMLFFGRGEWSPFGGWSVWAVVVVLGVSLIPWAAIAAQSSSSERPAAGASNG